MSSLAAHPVLALARKDLSRLFASPLAYLLLALFYLALGALFLHLLGGLRSQVQALATQALQSGAAPPVADLPASLLEAFVQALASLLLFVVPLLAVGLFAYEGRQGTLELLLTSPLTPGHLVAGKFLAGWVVLLCLLAPALALCLLTQVWSQPGLAWPAALLPPAGLLLLATAMLALTLFPAALTDSRVLAAVLSFVMLAVLWLAASLPEIQSAGLAQLLRFVSLPRHFDDFARGVFDTRHLVYYLSLSGLGLALSSLAVTSRRWRN
ncbi:MAG TPA: ABC transporter permease subunit [Acidobacteriota bacterium]|nr:ABC transporter permease subunit [Acidobacteriota bacterium]